MQELVKRTWDERRVRCHTNASLQISNWNHNTKLEETFKDINKALMNVIKIYYYQKNQ